MDVQPACVTVYVITVLPDKPDGLNTLPETPVPLNVPPVVPVTSGTRFTWSAVAQIVSCSVHAAFGNGNTVTVMVSASPQVPPMLYTIVCVPTVVAEGLKVPAVGLVMPDPLHVPPPVAAVSVIGDALEHSAETAVIVAFALGVTLMFCVDVAPHGAVPTVYVIAIGPDKPLGSNVFPVTPVPLQAPPAVPLTNVLRFTGAASAQSDVVLHAALDTGVTVMFCVDVPIHGDVPTVYVTAMVPDKPLGSKVFPVTPVPLQVPPVVPVTSVFRLIGDAPAQTVVVVHAGLEDGVTFIDWLDVAWQPVAPTVYVIVIGPDKPDGLKELPVTPVPLHVPPVVPVTNESRLTAGALEQTVALLHAAFGTVITLMLCVAVAVHGDAPTVYVTAIAPDKPDGLNEFPVTPVPLQEPPLVPVTSESRLIAEPLAQSVVVVQAALADGTTVMFCVNVSAQVLPAIYVIAMLPDKPDGLKLWPVTPVPLHVPPEVPLMSESRLIAPLPEHIGAGAVHAALAAGFTITWMVSEPAQEPGTM